MAGREIPAELTTSVGQGQKKTPTENQVGVISS